MEKTNKEVAKKNNVKIVMAVVIAMAVIILVGAFIYSMSKERENINPENSAEKSKMELSGDANNEAGEVDKMCEIRTPYFSLRYPAIWSSYLKCEETEQNDLFAETFYCVLGEQKIKLFTVYFGNPEVGDLLGKWETKDDSIAVSLEIYELAMEDIQEEEEQAIVYAMAEDVNFVVKSIEDTEGFVGTQLMNSAIESENTNSLVIETPYCTLEYPSNWEKYLKYQEEYNEDEEFIKFYCELESQEVELFTVYFGTLEIGDLIGYITTDNVKMAVSVELADTILNDNWTEDEKNIVYAMRECVNDMIQSIISCERYTVE